MSKLTNMISMKMNKYRHKKREINIIIQYYDIIIQNVYFDLRHNLLIWQRRFFLFVGQILQISTKFVLGNVIFSWQPLDYSAYYVQITRDTTGDTWARVNSTYYTVRDVLLYDSISINVRTSGSADNNIKTYNGNF